MLHKLENLFKGGPFPKAKTLQISLQNQRNISTGTKVQITVATPKNNASYRGNIKSSTLRK